jgi:hypothetical protein
MTINMGFNITKEPDMKRFEGDTYLKKAMDMMEEKSIPEVKNMFTQTTKGWEHQVSFVHIGPQKNTPNSVRAVVYPDGENADLYALLTLGSPTHPITPKNGRFLKFQPGYRAGTSPRMLNSQAKERSGDFVTALTVLHLGFEPREFAKQIKELYEPIFQDDMRRAISS